MLMAHRLEASRTALDMESLAKNKTSHAVSEAVLIALQCGIHIFHSLKLVVVMHTGKPGSWST